jgi:hypothetical protein
MKFKILTTPPVNVAPMVAQYAQAASLASYPNA